MGKNKNKSVLTKQRTKKQKAERGRWTCDIQGIKYKPKSRRVGDVRFLNLLRFNEKH